MRAAQKAVDAGVDGLVVEGGEGGGFKNPRPVSTLVLVPLICEKLDVPGYRVTTIDVSGSRITRVRVELEPGDDSSTEEAVAR